MTLGDSHTRRLYIGSHDGVCSLISADGGKAWKSTNHTPLSHAAARLTVSSKNPLRAYMAAYESGVYRTTTVVPSGSS